MFACIHICISIVSYDFFVAEELVYSVLEETADQPNMVYSSATKGQIPAQPAALSDLSANVYHLVDVEEKRYENLKAMKR